MKAALIGHGIEKSLTPIMHMAEAEQQGFDYQYEVVDVSKPEHQSRSLSDIITQAQSEGLAGLNITHPFKLEAAKLANKLIGAARELETVNTLVFDGGKVVGYNTDYVGYRSSLPRFLPAADLGDVVLIGAGGAGRSVALALVDQGTRRLTIVDKDYDQALHLQQLIIRHRPSAIVRTVSGINDVEFSKVTGVVNATPVGMASHPGAVLDVAELRRQAWVSDIVYLPLETVLLNRARMRGLRTMNGVGMAVYQAVAAFALLTGRQANPDRMLESFNSGVSDQMGILEAQTA